MIEIRERRRRRIRHRASQNDHHIVRVVGIEDSDAADIEPKQFGIGAGVSLRPLILRAGGGLDGINQQEMPVHEGS